MYFTIEDYRKIENWLKNKSIKDIELPMASTPNLEEQVVIIQNGKNKRIPLANLLNYITLPENTAPFEWGVSTPSALLKNSNNEIKNSYEVALGHNNKSNEGTLFSVGNGNENNRKNAFEIREDGSIYVEGIEGTLQDKLNHADNTTNLLTKVTYSELKNLRDTSNLVPGQQYCITDYVTTTVQEYTKSAGHQFDIIVTADDVNALNEKARAIHHEFEDTESDEAEYFANSNLNAWEIWYCLDNDIEKFAWADNSENGKGVIYRMIDEFSNDCPYDFKNIIFERKELDSFSISEDYVEEEPSSTDADYTNYIQYRLTFLNEQLTNGILPYLYTCNDGWGKGIISNFKDGITKEFFTFSVYENETFIDNSLTSKVKNNVISPYFAASVYTLNNIIFIDNTTSVCENNVFSDDCRNNTFGSDVHDNTFGRFWYNNVVGNSMYFSHGLDYGRYNTFGNNTADNTFGSHIHYNIIDSDSYNTSSENYLLFNYVGKECFMNHFFTRCVANILGKMCRHNCFGHNAMNIQLGENSTGNVFGNMCKGITGQTIRYNKFGNNCTNIIMPSNCDNNSLDSGVKNLTINTMLKNSFIGGDCAIGDALEQPTVTSVNSKRFGYYAHAEGNGTWAKGNCSHAEGEGTITNNKAEHACGTYNHSKSATTKRLATLFSVGIGTSDTDRKNAIEVKQNGDVYVLGIGNYNGNNSAEAMTLQKLVSEAAATLGLV